MISKTGMVTAGGCFLAVGLWLATTDLLHSHSQVAEPPVNEAVKEVFSPAASSAIDPTPAGKKPVEVIDLTVKNLELQAPEQVRVIQTNTLTDGFRPGSVDPSTAAAAEVARAQQWSLANVYVESSEVTDSGSVEYTIRASLRGDGARATATEVIAAARAVSPEVSVLAESLHFVTKPGDELDSLSSDAIRVRVKGGLTFEPSMLRWTFTTVPLRSSLENPGKSEPVSSDDAEPVVVAWPDLLLAPGGLP